MTGFRYAVRALTIVLALCAVATTAQAERRMALVIGNSDYLVQPLANPVNDAKLMAATLESIGFDVELHTDLQEREFLRAIIGFGRSLRAAGEDTVGLFFYAGHAIQADGENFLIPIDATLEDKLDLEIQAVEASAVMRALESAGNRLNMIFLDACRNNPFKAISRSGSRGLAKVDAPSGTLVGYSTAPGDVAADGEGRNSPYTRALSRAIREPGQPIELIMKQVRIEVMEQTGTRQVPWESSSLTGDFFFVPAAPVVAQEPEPAPAPAPQVPDQTVEIEYWKAIDAAGAEAGYADYLNRYPAGMFAGLAGSRLQAFENRRKTEAQSAARQQEISYFQTVQQAESIEGYEGYLQQYPDGLFAGIAQGRVEALQAEQTRDAAASQTAAPASKQQPTQTAALTTPAAAPPVDGIRRFTGQFVGTGGGGWTEAICGSDARHDMKAEIKDDRIAMTTQFGNDSSRLTAVLDGGGRFQMKVSMIMGKTSSVPFVFNGRYDGNRIFGEFFHMQSSSCSGKFSLAPSN